MLLELFIDRWAKPYYEWCEKNGKPFGQRMKATPERKRCPGWVVADERSCPRSGDALELQALDEIADGDLAGGNDQVVVALGLDILETGRQVLLD